MNQQFDLIIIGDSKHGHDAVKNIAGAKNLIKAAFISSTFKNKTTHDYLNVEYIKDDVILVDYKNRLFGCYLKSGDRLFCTHLVVATGLDYTPLLLNNKPVPSVFNTTDEITKQAKHMQAIVIGKNDADVKLAVAVAKKYKHVYFCTDNFTPEISEANMRKLNSIDNLVILPNAVLSKVASVDGALTSVELSNYASITCSAIFAKTKSTPAITFIPDNIIKKDADGYAITADNLESTVVPKCFITGNCACKNTKQMNTAMYETILHDF